MMVHTLSQRLLMWGSSDPPSIICWLTRGVAPTYSEKRRIAWPASSLS